MQTGRNQRAINTFFRKLLKPQAAPPRVVVTDKLRSYGAAMKKILKGVDHRQHKSLNNRAEHVHRSIRLREKRMGRCNSTGQAHLFLSAFEFPPAQTHSN
ncbi:MAG: DDE-type integrase/transposase/recombinase [Cyanobacteria bacterium P01_A01_bin.3]